MKLHEELVIGEGQIPIAAARENKGLRDIDKYAYMGENIVSKEEERPVNINSEIQEQQNLNDQTFNTKSLSQARNDLENVELKSNPLEGLEPIPALDICDKVDPKFKFPPGKGEFYKYTIKPMLNKTYNKFSEEIDNFRTNLHNLATFGRSSDGTSVNNTSLYIDISQDNVNFNIEKDIESIMTVLKSYDTSKNGCVRYESTFAISYFGKLDQYLNNLEKYKDINACSLRLNTTENNSNIKIDHVCNEQLKNLNLQKIFSEHISRLKDILPDYMYPFIRTEKMIEISNIRADLGDVAERIQTKFLDKFNLLCNEVCSSQGDFETNHNICKPGLNETLISEITCESSRFNSTKNLYKSAPIDDVLVKTGFSENQTNNSIIKLPNVLDYNGTLSATTSPSFSEVGPNLEDYLTNNTTILKNNNSSSSNNTLDRMEEAGKNDFSTKILLYGLLGGCLGLAIIFLIYNFTKKYYKKKAKQERELKISAELEESLH